MLKETFDVFYVDMKAVKWYWLGSGCGSVDRAVVSNPDVRGSNPVIGKIYSESLLSTVLKFEKTKIKEKRDREWPIFEKMLNYSPSWIWCQDLNLDLEDADH